MCEQAEAQLNGRILLLQNRYRLLEKEHYKSGNIGVLDLEHSSLDIVQETSVMSE